MATDLHTFIEQLAAEHLAAQERRATALDERWDRVRR